MPDEELRVLLLEGNPVDALVVSELLRTVNGRPGTTVTRVDSVPAALAAYHPDTCDVVLLDLTTPAAAHIDAIRSLVERDPDATVVALVNTDDESIGESAVRAGAQDFVAKNGLTGTALRRVVRYARARKASARDSEARLRAQKAFADSLIESMPGAFALIDDQGRVARWNAALEVQLEYRPEDIRDHPVLDFVYRDDHLRAAEAIAEAFRSGSARLDLRLVKKSGVPVPYNVTGVRVEDEGRACLLVSGQDQTDRRAMESQLVHAQKMEGIGRLAGGVAHDFNNVLAAVLSFSELVLMDSAPDDPRRADVETIREAAMRATGLTRQLLAFSRRQVFTPKVTDLNTLIAGLDRMVRRLIGEDVELVTIFGDPLGLVEVDPGQIESALVNLIVNARDAMVAGGTLTIQTMNVDLPPPPSPDALGGPAVRITVGDTGHGMSPEVMRQVFEPFFTTKEAGKGTGLGLPSVYGIVRQSRGQIAVASEVGKGTVLTIDLPRLPPSATQPVEPPVDAVVGGHETLIVAEDNHLVRRGIALVLGAKGYTILSASNGEEAVRLVQSHPGPIDLMLADVIMPGMSAPELAARVRAVRPDLRMVFMSGYMSESVESLRPWASGFMQKPFTTQSLTHAVREALDARRPGS